MTEALVAVENLTKFFPVRRRGSTGYVRAVEEVSLSIRKGETLGLVGESGCGKSTLGRTILRLYKPTSGRIAYAGETIFDSERKINAPIKPYCRKMQMIFQDPAAALDPRMTAGEAVAEALDIHRLVKSRKERWERVVELLNRVGLSEEQANRYPHEFSSGQQQRLGIARALAVEPEFLVCDEPVSSLDVSIQSQIVNMLEEMQAQMGLTYLFIAHNISVVQHISNRIAVMYQGNLVEVAESCELARHPLHPYTKAFLSADYAPGSNGTPSHEQFPMDEGKRPVPIGPPPGCRFAPRCPYSGPKCGKVSPMLREVAPNHSVACHLYNQF